MSVTFLTDKSNLPPQNLGKTYNIANVTEYRTENRVTKSTNGGQFVWSNDANAFSIKIPAIEGDVITFTVFDNSGHGYVFGHHKDDGTVTGASTKAMLETAAVNWMTIEDDVATVDVSGLITNRGATYMIFNVQYVNEPNFYIHSKKLTLRFDWLGLSEVDEKRLTDVETAVKLDKTVTFNPNLPCGYYEPTETTYTLGSGSVSNDVYAILDPYVDGAYCTKELLFTESSGLPGYVYRFKPQVPGNRTSGDNTSFPTILLVANHHGGEKNSAISTAYFFKDMLDNWASNPILEYLRFCVNFVVVPVANPYGFNKYQHQNANSVDLNRNYDANWALTEEGQNYSGASAASEIETQAIQTLMQNTQDALLYIDYHTYGGADEWWELNWHFLCASPYATAAPEELAVWQIQRATAHYKQTYFPDGFGDGVYTGFINRDNRTGNSKVFARQNGIPNALVFEGVNQLMDEDTPFTQRCIRLNVEQIGNYIFNAVSWFVRNPNRIRQSM